MYIIRFGCNINFGTMESVSVSSKDSASKKEANGSTKTCQQATGTKRPSDHISYNDDFLRKLKGERPSQSLDERRDDYFAASRPMWRHIPTSTGRPNWYNDQKHPLRAYYLPPITRASPSQWWQAPHSMQWHSRGVHHQTKHPMHDSRSLSWNTHGRPADYARIHTSAPTNGARGYNAKNRNPLQRIPGSYKKNTSAVPHHVSRVLFQQNITKPKEMPPFINDKSSKRERLTRRSNSNALIRSEPPPNKKTKIGLVKEGFDKLNLLCAATLDLGPLQENPTGCSCPKSRCIALYCDCFKAGRRCDPITCSCLNCKNTVKESGPNGARSKAIQGILARNPRAFRNAGHPHATNKPPPGEQGCNCIRSRCLKLYCTCFHKGITCNPLICTCVGCLNVEGDTSGMRQQAIEMTLEKRPDAFKEKSRTKILGAGCACKNNQCIRKYCECFRTKLKCTRNCKCKECKNR